MSDILKIRRALVSVYDKTNLIEISKELVAAGVQLVSTGSTASKLIEAGLPVVSVESVTGFPECFDGRVKTLHPKIHGGLLADRRLAKHNEQLEELGIEPFDLVISNLYPFTQTVASGAGIDECIEQIDIGGPAMVRASAKNHASVAVITSPAQYPLISQALQYGGFSLAQRQQLATEAYRHTASYDIAVANWMGALTPTVAANAGENASEFPSWLGASWSQSNVLRYGENSHQAAALYLDNSIFHSADPRRGLAGAQPLQGKEMSYNNYTDADAAYRAAYDFDAPAAAIIKHANPCGIAVGNDIVEAHLKAHECDSVSAYGGVIAVNRPVTAALAQQIAPIFTEVLLAPDYEDEALSILAKKKNLRVLKVPAYPADIWQMKQISGGMLLQTADAIDDPADSPANWTLVSGEAANEETLADLEFAWRACRSVKSNAILLASGKAAVGIGMGQVNRVDSCQLAVTRADHRAAGSVAASDAFFPFADGVQILIDGGIKAIVQPGGSIRDAEVIETANAAGITMYFTSVRHFFH